MTESKVFEELQIAVFEDDKPLMAREWENPYTMVLTDNSGKTQSIPISEETYKNLLPMLE